MGTLSYTTRVTLMSLCLTGAILAGAMLWSLDIVHRLGLERLDAELYEAAFPHMIQPDRNRMWDDIEIQMSEPAGKSRRITMVVIDEEAEVVYQSLNWPGALEVDQFPLPEGRPEPPPRQRLSEYGESGQVSLPEYGMDPDQTTPGAYRPERRWEEDAEAGAGAGGERRPPREANDRRPPPRQDDGRRPPRREDEFRPPRRDGPPDERGPGRGQPPRLALRDTEYFDHDDGRAEWRLAVMGNSEITMVVGIDTADFKREMATLNVQFILATLGALALMGLAGFVVARRSLKPMQRLTRMAGELSARELHGRLAIEKGDAEFGPLIEVFNGMLGRLETSFGQATRFSADAAHELNTPLTILQGELEQTVQSSEAGSAEQVRASHLLEEVQRLRSIVRKLLLLSLADSGRLKVSFERVPFTEMIEEELEDTVHLAPTLQVNSRLTSGVVVNADPDLVRQVVRNLLSNARRYNQENGFIRVTLDVNTSRVKLKVSNSGTPVPAESRDKIFDRFYRVDEGRNRRDGGTGLGLSLAKEIARAHGGSLMLGTSDASKTDFVFRLPVSPDS